VRAVFDPAERLGAHAGLRSVWLGEREAMDVALSDLKAPLDALEAAARELGVELRVGVVAPPTPGAAVTLGVDARFAASTTPSGPVAAILALTKSLLGEKQAAESVCGVSRLEGGRIATEAVTAFSKDHLLLVQVTFAVPGSAGEQEHWY
jgi:hypothetical protein